MDEPAELVELCGEDGPVRLLELAPNEVVHTAVDPVVGWDAVTRYHDRFVAVVHAYDDAVDGEAVFDLQAHERQDPVSSRLVSVDECGTDRVELMSQTVSLDVPGDPERPWLACGRVDGFDGLYRIDPSGRTAALPLGARGACPYAFTSGDVVFAIEQSAEETGGTLVRYDRAGKAEVLIAEGVHFAEAVGTTPSWDPDLDGHLLVTLEQGDLIDLSVDTGTHETIAAGVERASVDGGGRYLLLEYETAPLSLELRDRETGASISATLPASSDGEPYVVDRAGFASIYFPDDEDSGTSILSVDDGRRVELAGQWQTFAVLPSGTLLMVRYDEYSVFALDPGSVEPRWLEDGRAYPAVYEDGMVVYLEDQLGLEQTFPPTGDRPQALVHVPVDGSPRSIVVTDVFQPLRLGDGRYATTRGYAGDYHGDLVLRDDDGSTRVIDHDVYWFFARFGDGNSVIQHVDSTSFIYPVRDPGHERTGLWRVEVAP